MHDTIGEIDVAFVIDTTGSMQPFIDEARQHAAAEAERIAGEGGLDIRFAVVEYRDHPPQDMSFVARVYPFGDGDHLRRTLATLQANGGGDTQEAVLDGLHAVSGLPWRQHSDRLVFLIGDAPPHGYGEGDSFPEGCPCGLVEGGIVELLGSRRIRLYAHSIAGHSETTQVFTRLAEACGGNCTEVERARPDMATASYSGTLSKTSDLVGASRSYYAAAAAAPEASDAEIAVSLGWSVDMATGVKTYLKARGLDPVKPRRRSGRKPKPAG